MSIFSRISFYFRPRIDIPPCAYALFSIQPPPPPFLKSFPLLFLGLFYTIPLYYPDPLPLASFTRKQSNVIDPHLYFFLFLYCKLSNHTCPAGSLVLYHLNLLAVPHFRKVAPWCPPYIPLAIQRTPPDLHLSS